MVTITNLDLINFAVSHNGSSTGNLDGTGSWFYEIDCTTAGCGSGGSSPNPGPLTFTIQNITTGDFIINNKTANGFLFASDICTQKGVTGGCTGITGDIAAIASPIPAPEPVTPSVLGAALLGFEALCRRRLICISRTVTVRTERLVSEPASTEPVNPEALKYLNHLSDHLFVLGRRVNDNGARDVLWRPGANR